jgi:MoxR-like ATPase
VAAANDWPSACEGGKELAAVFDRFLFRSAVRPVRSADGRRRLLWAADHTPTLSTSVTPAEVDRAHRDAAALPWSAAAREALEAILRELAREGVRPGDRRQRKAVGAARAYAYLAGADRVDPEHLEVLRHVLWDDPEEQPAVCTRVIAKVADPAGMRVTALLLEADEVVAGADARDLAAAATAAAKLAEIEKRLAALAGTGRADRVRTHVRDQLRQLKLASLAAV